MTEIWAAIGASTTLLAGFMVYLATQIQAQGNRIDNLDARFDSRIDTLDAKFTARFDALNDRLDRVIELLATHQHH